MTPELKPCPFCGGILLRVRKDLSGWVTGYYVHCLACQIDGPSKLTEAEAIVAWNQRAPGWQPIATAPKDGRYIMAQFSRGVAQVICWDESKQLWRDSLGRIQDHPMQAGEWFPTHWLPLPEPPKEGE